MNTHENRHLAPSSVASAQPAYLLPGTIRISPDFLVLDGLTLPGPVTIGNVAERRETPALLLDLDDAQRARVLDHLLALGYKLQFGARKSDGERARLVYARAASPSASSTLHIDGHVEIQPDVRFRVPAMVATTARMGAGAILEGTLLAQNKIELEEGAQITGEAITEHDLILHEAARVHGGVQAGHLRFHSSSSSQLQRLEPLQLQPVPPLVRAQPEPAPAVVQPVLAPAPAPAQEQKPAEPPTALPPVTSAFTTFEGTWPGAPLTGRYRIVAWATLKRTQVASVLRGHWDTAGSFLEVEVLEVEGRNVSLLAHPGTPRQRRIRVDINELAEDDVTTTLLPILQRVSTLRILFQEDVVMAAASVESLRWLITVFGKMLRLDSRLHRLKEMRLFSLDELEAGNT